VTVQEGKETGIFACHHLGQHIRQVNISIAIVFVKAYIFLMVRRAQFDMQQFFQALGDNTRLRLLNLMGEQELCVCYFVEILGSPQPKISRHLAYLRNAGIVSARREGKWMHYRVVMPPHIGATQILRQTLKWLREDKAMQADRARLAKACCSPAKYALDGVPLPTAISEQCCEVC
jgi:ArsR family transcriptional regulator, arsenate/arsenite/antimonite-responsive transcriptional repressor